MKTFHSIALSLALFAAAAAARADEPPYAPPPPPPPAGDVGVQTQPGPEVSRRLFEERLSPYGRWADTPEYGRVWVPAVSVGWRPYTYGHWVMTDWGWTWVSDEPFGWAAYHYGRWYWGGGVGWYWVPGRVWGPAWVSWRWSHGYIAWAPLVPRRAVMWGVRSPYWVAVPTAHFTRPIATVALAPRLSVGIVARTAPLRGAYARPGRGLYGPPAAHISRATGVAVRPVPVHRVVPGAIPHARSGYARAAPPRREARPPGPGPAGHGRGKALGRGKHH